MASAEAREYVPSILIVDDDRVLSERLVHAFNKRGFEAQGAASFDEGMAIARREPPEYAVVDLRIGENSGLELSKELLALDPETQIVILTGYGSIATAIDAVRLGAVYYL